MPRIWVDVRAENARAQFESAARGVGELAHEFAEAERNAARLENEADDAADEVARLTRLVGFLGSMSSPQLRQDLEDARDAARQAQIALGGARFESTRLGMALDDAADEARSLDRALDRLNRSRVLRRLAFEANQLARRLRTAVASVLMSLLRNLGSTLLTLGTVILRWGAIVGLATGFVSALLPPVVSLLALVMLLGPAIATVGAGIATLVLGFRGFSDVVSAGLSGDMDEFNKGLKGLSDNAADAAKAIVEMAPAWRAVFKETQAGLFARVGKSLRMLNDYLRPIVGEYLPLIGVAFGLAFNEVSKFLTADYTRGQIVTIFEGILASVRNLLGVCVPLLQIFLDITEVATGKFVGITASIQDAAEKAAGWVRAMKESGKLGEWLDRAFETVGKLKEIGQEIFGVFKELFSIGQARGGSFLDNLRNSIADLKNWIASGQGEKFVENMIGAAEAIADIGKAIKDFNEDRKALSDWFDDLVNSATNAFSTLVSIAMAAFRMILTGAKLAFSWSRDMSAVLGAASAAFDAFAADANASLGSIRDRSVTVTARLVGEGANAMGGAMAGIGRSSSSRIQMRAAGGPVRAGMPYVVGEHRPELFVPNRDGYIMPRVPQSGSGGRASGRPGGVTMTVGPGGDRAVAALVKRLYDTGVLRFS